MSWSVRWNGSKKQADMLLADTNILSTFAKIDQLPLLLRLFGGNRLGVVPAVYAEFQAGLNKGYADLQTVVDLIQQGQIDLIAPTAQEVFQKDALPTSFDAGERETLVVARLRGYPVLTNETQIKNWCRREEIEYWDLPALLRALWKTNVASWEVVRSLIDRIEAKDRIVFRNKEAILQE
jgi:predicted nucleic acid-binding protein